MPWANIFDPFRVVKYRDETFKEEYASILKKYNAEYDERYVWD